MVLQRLRPDHRRTR
nr:hypothetical protein [Pseudomonas fitomaticsae]